MKITFIKLIGMLAIAGLIGVSCESITDSDVEEQADNQIETLGTGELLMPNAIPANSEIFWYQDFSENADGWLDSDDEWYGTITHNSAEETATVEGDEISAPFSRFDGFRDVWPGDYFAEIEVYLDPDDWSLGEGFDYTVASSGSDGRHQRDFIFHLTKDTSTETLLVGGSNNTNFAPREDLENLNSYTVTEAGWYTLQHNFYNDNGQLAVDLNLYKNSTGDLLFTETRTNATDLIPDEVGGNAYSWFTVIAVEGGIEVDNHSLYRVLEEPETIENCQDGAFEAYGFRNQGQCIRYVNTGKDSR